MITYWSRWPRNSPVRSLNAEETLRLNQESLLLVVLLDLLEEASDLLLELDSLLVDELSDFLEESAPLSFFSAPDFLSRL